MGESTTGGVASVSSIVDETLEGCTGFMVASHVFLRLIQSEVSLMEGIVPNTHHAHVLDNLIKQPVDFFMSKGEALLTQAKKGVAHNDHSVVLSCLRLLRHVKALLPEYRIILTVIIARVRGLIGNPWYKALSKLLPCAGLQQLLAIILSQPFVNYYIGSTV